jgi:hypothetical protein
MNYRSFIGTIVGASLLLFMAAGCDRSSSPKQTRGQQATTAPTTIPATRPGSCSMTIDGAATPFPGARLRISKDGDEWIGVLFSDDPAEAIRPDYQGNSFYLTMHLSGVGDDGKLNDARWTLQNTERAEGDAPEGIFVRGQQVQLRPINVKAAFEDRGAIVVVKLNGEFQSIQDKDPENRTRKKVEGRIEAACDRK